MNKLTSATKRFVALILAIVMFTSAIPMDVFAAGSVSLLDGKITVTSEGTKSELAANESAGVTATVEATASSGCGSTSYTENTNTITITNTSGEKGNLSFDYVLGSNIGGFTIDGVSYSDTGVFAKSLEVDETVVVTLKSVKGAGTATVNLNNIKIEGSNISYEVSFEKPENGTIVINGETYTEAHTVTTNYETGVTASAIANENYKFVGWLDESDSIIYENADITINPTGNMKLRALFAKTSESKAVFLVAGRKYLDLNKAITAAENSNDKKIVLVGDGTITGDYTIPAGVTLLIPFDDAHTCYTDEPATVGYTGTPILSATPNAYVTPTAYKTLTMASGSSLTVNGAISISAKHAHAAGSKDYGAAPSGKCGFVRMEADSEIIVNNGGSLYAWGFIIGDGRVTVENGGKSYEYFQFSDFRGGSVTTNMNNNAQKVFVLSQYYVQNIEVEEVLKHGAEVHVCTSVFMNKMQSSTTLEFIGADGMFEPGENSTLTKKYNPKTDRLELTVDGTVALKNISMSLSGVSMDSSKYVLPINNNMTITLKEGAEVAISQDVALLPGVELNIAEGATFTIAEGKNMYVYDSEQWGLYVHSLGGAQKFRALVYSPTREYIRTVADLVDAKINVNGTLQVNGALYTTSSGANIVSLGETGKIVFNSATPDNGVTYQFDQSQGDGSDGKGYIQIPVTPAKLHNADNSYSETKKTPAGGIFSWNAEQDRWLRENAHEITWKNEDGTILSKEFVADGETPTFDGTPTKNGNAQYGYIFAGWDKEVVPVTGDAEYTATYTQVVNKYTVTWLNENGDVLVTEEVEYGSKPEYKGETPTKEATAQYSYTFAGWDKEVVEVTGEVTYTATYTSTVNKHTVTWLNENGDVLATEEVEYGSTPEYKGETPSKAGDVQYSYTFAGWDKEVVEVTGEVTYTATYTSTVNKYTVTWLNADGNVLTTEEVEYGSKPEYKGETPTKEATAQYSYTFAGWSPEVVEVTGEVTYTATYTSTVNKYTVVWLNADGNELKKEEVDYGKIPSYEGLPSKAADVQYTYSFAGWDKKVVEVTENVTYTATYTSTVNKYKVTWLNADGNELVTEKVEYGTKPEYKGETPTKEATDQYSYTFAGWSPEVVEVTGEVTYTAVYTSTVNKYTVTWLNEDGNELATEDVEYGTKPEYKGETPTKKATAQYSYTFAGWSPEVVAVTGNVTYKATYTSTVNKYTVTWLNEDGNELTTEEVEYGSKPEYKGATPTKEADAQYTYTFAGWSPEVVEVTGEVTYTAVYTSKVNKYKVTWLNADGNVLVTEEVEYGTKPEYKGATPTKEADVQYTYAFAGWDKEVTAVTGETTYTATYSKTVNEYTVTWVDENGNVLVTEEVEYGTKPEYKGETPTKEATAQYSYTFAGWSPEVVEVTGNATYTATYTSTVNKYTVTWKNYDGTELKVDKNVEYGATVSYDGETPVKPKTEEFHYIFAGWNSTDFVVKGDITYTAVFEEREVGTYKVFLVDKDGSKLVDKDGNPIDLVLVKANKEVVIDVTPVKTGYTFNGWETIPEKMPEEDITLTATWTINQYTITFNTDGGTTIKPITQDYGTVVTAPADPAKEGYTFAGWNVEIPKTMPAKDMTITAKWNVNQYTITFDTDGGSDVDSITKDYGTEVVMPADPVKEGYTFTGWDMQIPDTMGANNITITATWKINQYTVRFDSAGGSDVSEMVFDFKADIKDLPTPTRVGYTFVRWELVPVTRTVVNGNEVPETMPARDLMLVAIWDANEYTITFNTDGGTTIKPITQDFETTVKAPANPVKEGYTFVGWDVEIPKTMPAENMTIKAQWKVNQYTIRFDTDGGSEVKALTQDFATAVTAPANPVKEGYTFVGWDVEIPKTMPAKDMTIKAQWKVNQYTITFDTDGGSVVKPITKDYGTALDVPAVPTKEGYTFAGWDVEIPETMPAKDMTIKAIWTINQYTVRFDSVGGTKVEEMVFNYNEAIKNLPVPTREGYTFVRWEEVPETMPAKDIVLVAIWDANEYTITFNTDGGTTIKPITQDFATTVKVPANPVKEGYTFVGWDIAIPATMPAENMTITAQWKVNQYTITFDTDGGSEVKALTQDFATAVTAPANPVKEGYTFAGWDVEIPESMPAKDMTIKANWKVNQYTITFDTDGGSEVDSITQDYGTEIPVIEAPVKEGYNFGGWTPALGTTMPAENVTVKAIWKVNQYTIEFVTDGGTAIDSIVADFGTPIVKPADPVKEGYTFVGWDVEIPETMPAKYVKVTAVWKINQYTITFDTDGGTEIAPITQDFATTVVAPKAPTKVGHTFVGWDVEVPTTMPAKNMTIKAKWNVNQYTITFMTNGGTEIAPITQNYGTKVTAPAAPTKTGYTFLGWDVILPETMPEGGLTLSALWAPVEYTINWDTDGDGKVDDTTKVAYDSVPTHADGSKKTTAEYTYVFIGWTPSVTTVTGEALYTAQFKAIPNEYTITFDTDGGNKIADVVYAYGAEITAPKAPAKDGYTFLGWTPALPETMPAANVTVKAQWKYTYTGWVNDANGTTYHVNGEQPYANKWVDIEDETYYFDANGYVVKGLYETTSPDGSYTTVFIFDKETGAFEKDMNGIHEFGKDTYFVENGEVVKVTGLVRIEKEDGEVNYYFFGADNKAVKNATIWISEENANEYLPANNYTLDEEGVILHDEDTSKNGMVVTDGVKYYYIDGVKAYMGLVKEGKYYYYANTSGTVITNRSYWITKTNGLLDEGSYIFDAEGRIVLDNEIKNGIYAEDGSLFYYVDGVRTYAGLIKVDGAYYYVRTSGELAHSCAYWITKTNGLMEQALYTFDANGKMIVGGMEQPEEPTVKNGIYAEDGSLFYYVNGVRTYAGLIKVDGAYYYVRTSGELAHSCTYWTTKTNGLMPEALYTFDANGKMTNPFNEPDDETTTDGIVEVDGKYYYYENGNITYAGLIVIDGNYYYVKTSGEVVTNCNYWITKTNGLMEQGSYKFDATGKMDAK